MTVTILASALTLFTVVLQANAQNGVPLWINRYGVTNNTEFARDLALDGSGNVFVTGGSHGEANTVWGFLTVAYSSTGALLWTNHYGAAGDFNDSARAITVAGTGAVVVTGHSLGAGGYDYVTVAYSSAGTSLWTNRYGGPINDWDFASDVAVAGNGNVVVTGFDNYLSAYATLAYSSSGVPLWTNRYRASSGEIFANAVAVDGSGSVYVTGNAGTVKYSSAGAPVWTNRFSVSDGRAIAFGTNDVVFVAGNSVGGIGNPSQYLLLACSSAGTPLWTNRYKGPGNGANTLQAMAVGSDGKVVVTGHSWGNSSPDYATVAYSSAGVPLWTNRYNGPDNESDIPTSVAVDQHGNVFVTGNSIGNGTGFDFVTLAYSSAGVPLWTNRYNGPGNGDDEAYAVAVDAAGSAFVTGSSRGLGGYYDNDFITIKYPPIVPPVQIAPLPGNNNALLLSWPSGFTLQTASTLNGTFTNISGATSPYTNSVTGSQGFFRLVPN